MLSRGTYRVAGSDIVELQCGGEAATSLESLRPGEAAAAV